LGGAFSLSSFLTHHSLSTPSRSFTFIAISSTFHGHFYVMFYAQALYPGVPIELVVSIGTGYNTKVNSAASMGWDLLVNQLVASSTETEDVHNMLMDFLPADRYFRFNPQMDEAIPIDVTDKTTLNSLKALAKKTFRELERNPVEAKRLEVLAATLKKKGA